MTFFVRYSFVFLFVFTLLFDGVVLGAPLPPEEVNCYRNLIANARKNPNFRNINFSAVQKVDQTVTPVQKSGTFSVATYQDFLNAFNRPIPRSSSNLKKYPSQMGGVPASGKFWREVHQANRNNAGMVLYQDNSVVSLNDGERGNGNATFKARQNGRMRTQSITGHYVNSKYVTFGRESALEFSFPSREADPGMGRLYPTGRQIKDMREYMLYTHHLTNRFGGDFLSCGLIKVEPLAGFVLKDSAGNTQPDVNWNNYGGIRIPESNTRVRKLTGPYRLSEIDFTINHKRDADKRLLRYHVMNVSYDNRNSFMNQFITSRLFDVSMKHARNVSLNAMEMRRDFYKRISNSGLEIAEGLKGEFDQATVLNQQDFKGFDIKKRSTGLNYGSYSTYYFPDQSTVDAVCKGLGKFNRGKVLSSDVATAPGWNYRNLAIRGVSKQNAVQDYCTNGMACIQGKVNFISKLRCYEDSVNGKSVAVAPAPAPAPTFNFGSGTVICTHYNKKGLLSDDLYAAEQVYGSSVDPRLYAGYLYWAVPFVSWLEKNEWADVVVAPLVNAWAKQVAFDLGERDSGSWIGQKMMAFGEPLTMMLGKSTLVERSLKATGVFSLDEPLLD